MYVGACHCGGLSWRFDANPHSTTACNCTICRRYGALWAYGVDEVSVTTSGPSHIYSCGDEIGFHFCPTCGCLAFYKALQADAQGQRYAAVNFRMIDDPDRIADLPIRHFEGLHRFETAPRDQRRVADMWF